MRTTATATKSQFPPGKGHRVRRSTGGREKKQDHVMARCGVRVQSVYLLLKHRDTRNCPPILIIFQLYYRLLKESSSVVVRLTVEGVNV